MKKKDLIFYAGTAVLFAFSTQQVKADEQHASDQTPENTSAIVATTTSSEAQNTVSEGVGVEKGIQAENTVATEAAPVTPTLSNNQSSVKGWYLLMWRERTKRWISLSQQSMPVSMASMLSVFIHRSSTLV